MHAVLGLAFSVRDHAFGDTVLVSKQGVEGSVDLVPRVVVDEAADAVEPRLRIVLGRQLHQSDDPVEIGIVCSVSARLAETVDSDPHRRDENSTEENGGGDLDWLAQGHRWFTRLAALKQLLDVGQLQLDIGRAAVVALAGEGRPFHITQKTVHFLGCQSPAGPHAAVTRHC